MNAVEPHLPPGVARIVRQGCAQLFVIFAARRDGEAAFAAGGDFLSNAKLGGRNIILVRDPHDRNYARGLGAIINTPLLLARWLRTQRALMSHVREVYTLGHSSGGYGALLFGDLLGVDRAFVFSPRAARVEDADVAKSALLAQLATYNGKTSYEICFSPLSESDAGFAEQLGRCPGVTLAPRTEFGAAHGVLGRLLASGELARMLPSFAPAVAS